MRLDYISLSSSDSSTASLSLSLANQGFLHSKALYGLFVGNDITGQHVGEVTSTEKEREHQKASHRSHLRRGGRFGQVRPKHTDLENNLTQSYSQTCWTHILPTPMRCLMTTCAPMPMSGEGPKRWFRRKRRTMIIGEDAGRTIWRPRSRAKLKSRKMRTFSNGLQFCEKSMTVSCKEHFEFKDL